MNWTSLKFKKQDRSKAPSKRYHFLHYRWSFVCCLCELVAKVHHEFTTTSIYSSLYQLISQEMPQISCMHIFKESTLLRSLVSKPILCSCCQFSGWKIYCSNSMTSFQKILTLNELNSPIPSLASPLSSHPNLISRKKKSIQACVNPIQTFHSPLIESGEGMF